jgi:hypothetical protein
MEEQTTPAVEPASRRRWPSARTLLAVLLLAMAAGQASDPGGFSRILDAYRVFPGPLATVAAFALVALETMAGVALLWRRRCGAALALAVAMAWTVLVAQAFARALPLANCGCFGVHLGQPLRWWVLVEDAEFIALAAWVHWAQRRARFLPPTDPGPHPAGVESCRSGPVAGAGRTTEPTTERGIRAGSAEFPSFVDRGPQP